MATILKHAAVGVEIRWHTVAAAIRRPGGSPVASAFADGPGNTDDWTGLTEALQTLSGQLALTGAICRVGLPPEEFMIRGIRLPFQDPKRIRMVLPMALDPLVPDPVDTLSIAFTTHPMGDGSFVVAAAIAKDRLNHYEAALTSAGMKARVITVGGASALGSMDSEGSNRFVAQVVGHQVTVYAVSDARIVGMRILPTTSREDDINAMTASLRQTMVGIRTIVPGFAPQQLVFLGGSPEAVAAADDLGASLNLAVSAPDTGNTTGKTLAVLAEALAADRGRWPHWNFQQRPQPMASLWSHHRRHVIAMAVLLFFLGIIGMINYGADLYFLRKNVARMDHHLEQLYRRTFPEARTIKNPLAQMRAKVRQATESKAAGENGTVPVRVVDLLATVATALPPSLEVALTRLTVEGTRLTMAGIANNFNTVDTVKERLGKTSLLSDATIVSAEQDNQANQVRFSLKATVTP